KLRLWLDESHRKLSPYDMTRARENLISAITTYSQTTGTENLADLVTVLRGLFVSGVFQSTTIDVFKSKLGLSQETFNAFRDEFYQIEPLAVEQSKAVAAGSGNNKMKPAGVILQPTHPLLAAPPGMMPSVE